jgi:hypothetical protein
MYVYHRSDKITRSTRAKRVLWLQKLLKKGSNLQGGVMQNHQRGIDTDDWRDRTMMPTRYEHHVFLGTLVTLQESSGVTSFLKKSRRRILRILQEQGQRLLKRQPEQPQLQLLRQRQLQLQLSRPLGMQRLQKQKQRHLKQLLKRLWQQSDHQRSVSLLNLCL